MSSLEPGGCPYCPVAAPARVVLRSALSSFVVDERFQGALRHSGVIVPVAHRVTVFDLTADEIADAFVLLAQVKAWLDDTVAPDGYNVGWNAGAVAGQEVFHAHLHVIPRFAAEPLAGKGIRSLLKSDANRW